MSIARENAFVYLFARKVDHLLRQAASPRRTSPRFRGRRAFARPVTCTAAYGRHPLHDLAQDRFALALRAGLVARDVVERERMDDEAEAFHGESPLRLARLSAAEHHLAVLAHLLLQRRADQLGQRRNAEIVVHAERDVRARRRGARTSTRPRTCRDRLRSACNRSAARRRRSGPLRSTRSAPLRPASSSARRRAPGRRSIIVTVSTSGMNCGKRS